MFYCWYKKRNGKNETLHTEDTFPNQTLGEIIAIQVFNSSNLVQSAPFQTFKKQPVANADIQNLIQKRICELRVNIKLQFNLFKL